MKSGNVQWKRLQLRVRKQRKREKWKILSLNALLQIHKIWKLMSVWETTTLNKKIFLMHKNVLNKYLNLVQVIIARALLCKNCADCHGHIKFLQRRVSASDGKRRSIVASQ